MKTYEETDRWEESVLEKVREKMKWVCEKNREKIPYTTEPDGRYDDRSDASRNWNGDDGLNWWTNGYWSGLLWLLYQDTRKERYLETAREADYKLEKCLMDFTECITIWDLCFSCLRLQTGILPEMSVPEERPFMQPICWQDGLIRKETLSVRGMMESRTPGDGPLLTV